MGLQAVHEDVEGLGHVLPRLGAGGFSDISKAGDDPVEIGQDRPVLGEQPPSPKSFHGSILWAGVI